MEPGRRWAAGGHGSKRRRWRADAADRLEALRRAAEARGGHHARASRRYILALRDKSPWAPLAGHDASLAAGCARMTHSTSHSCPYMHAHERHSSYASARAALDPSVSTRSIAFPACTASLTGAPSTPCRCGHQTDGREFFDTELYGNARADRILADPVTLFVPDARILAQLVASVSLSRSGCAGGCTGKASERRHLRPRARPAVWGASGVRPGRGIA